MLKILAESIARIRQSLSLDSIFHNTVTEVRRCLDADRVALFQFDPEQDWEGEFVAEDFEDGWTSVLGANVYDHCFGRRFAPMYQQGRVQAVADIYDAGLSDCHIKILGRFQVKANLVVPVLKNEELWGLLCVHQCAAPRRWDPEEVELIQHIAEHFSVALQQAEYMQTAQAKTKVLADKVGRERALAKTIGKIRQSLEIEQLFEATSTEIRQLLNADRVALFQFYPEQNWDGQFVAEDVRQGFTAALETAIQSRCFGEQFPQRCWQDRVQAITDIHANGLSDCHVEMLEQLQVQSNLVVSILQGETLWGLLCVHQCDAPRVWGKDEIEFVEHISEHLSIALKQVNTLNQVRYQAEQQKALTGVISRIRESIDLDIIFNTTTHEVRRLLNTDRVGIFRFACEAHTHGEFIAEDHAEGLASVVAEKVRDDCFGENYANLYQQGRLFIAHNIYEVGMQDCHVDILERFQVKANMVAPLLEGDNLWGLLCIHQCNSSRQWQDSEIEFTRQIAEQLSVALKQQTQLVQLQNQATELADAVSQRRSLQRQKLLTETINAIRQSLDIEKVFQITADKTRHLIQSDRVAIYQFFPDWSGEFVAESIASGWLPLVGAPPILRDTHLVETQGGRYARQETYAVDDIYQVGHSECHIELLEQFQAKAYVVAPIMVGDRLWGLLGAYQNATPREWEADEVELMAQVGVQLGVALKQAEALAQVRQQAAALQKATERQQALSRTIDKIRQSLDIDTIFTTTTQEVRQLLEVDRVSIYRFTEGWRGAFVADSIIDGWQATLPSQPVIEQVFAQPEPNGQYPRNEVFVPISHGERLWGLLIAYQTSSPRYWADAEVDLLAQVGVQLGIALQQAELLKQTQQQTEQLNQALQKVHNTQAQLVQGEKMAELGQMMAGISHEINNPVSFVFSNIKPAQQYVEELLNLVALYQSEYPQPTVAIQERIDDLDLEFLAADLPKLLDSMKMGATRIRDIVRSMRVFSRMDESNRSEADIHQGLDSTLLLLNHRLKSQDNRPEIQLVKNYGELPLVNCYAGQLNQVFMNLLGNAIDALRGNEAEVLSQISVTTHWRKADNHVVIEIADNGPGIVADIMDDIFKPFFTTKLIEKGTGLGLSISHQIVTDLHEGQLRCESELGAGTVFYIELPVAISESE